jgi:hypothetical protein
MSGKKNISNTIPVKIVSRLDDNSVLFCADVEESVPMVKRIMAALILALRSGADLSGADLSGANLSGADLCGVDYRGTKIGGGGFIKRTDRSDGYEFSLFDCEDGQYRIMAGCRWFTLEEAWKHWSDTRDGTDLGEETFDILVMFEHHAARCGGKTMKF